MVAKVEVLKGVSLSRLKLETDDSEGLFLVNICIFIDNEKLRFIFETWWLILV